MNIRFTLPFTSTREVGETYIDSNDVVLGVILNKTNSTVKVAAFGDCAIKCDSVPDEGYMLPVWYDSNSNEFKAFTPADSQNKTVGYVKPYQRDQDGNIISKYDLSFR